MSILRFTAAGLAATLSLVATASAADVSVCSPSSAAVECLLPVEHADFDRGSSRFAWAPPGVFPTDLPQWEKVGDNGGQLAFTPGQTILQVVDDPVVAGSHAVTYVPSLRVRSEGGEATVRFTAQVLDGANTRTVFTQDYVVGNAWSTPSGGFAVGSVSSPRTVLSLSISRVDTNDAASLKLDGVQVLRQRLAGE